MDPLIVTQALNVVYGVTTLAVLVLGLAVIFGLLGVLNVAHGEFIMAGAYCAYVTQASGWPFLAALPLALMVCGALGLVVERGLIRPLYARPFDTLVATWGLSLLLRKLAEAIFGMGFYSLDMPLAGTVALLGTDYPAYRADADRRRCGRADRPVPVVPAEPHRHPHPSRWSAIASLLRPSASRCTSLQPTRSWPGPALPALRGC